MKRMRVIVAIVFCFSIMATTAESANYFKDYIPLPQGTKGILYYLTVQDGNEAYVNGDKVSDDTNMNAFINMFRFVWYPKEKLFGTFAYDFNVLMPMGHLSLDGAGAGGNEISTSQIGDLLLANTIWWISNPETKTHVATSLYATIPTGEYDNNRALNMGGNRWAFKAEAALEQGFLTNFNLGVQANVEFYTDNDDVTVSSLKGKRDPLFGAEAHLSYDFTKSIFLSADYFYSYGGENKLSGINLNDEKNNHAVGLTTGFIITPQFNLFVNYTKDLEVENGIKSQSLNVRFGYLF